MGVLVLRFLAGGVAVVLFSAMGEVLRPQSLAGLLGAAPSVALATFALTVMQRGNAYAAVEARSMVLGSVAFLVYAWACSQVLLRKEARSPVVTIAALPLWFAVAFGLEYGLLR